MPESLDRVTIALWHGPFELPWSSRDQLLAEMRRLDDASEAIRAFEGAGASAPIRLGRPDREMLAVVIDGWADEVGKEDLPAGIWDLRLALADDLRNEHEGGDPDVS